MKRCSDQRNHIAKDAGSVKYKSTTTLRPVQNKHINHKKHLELHVRKPSNINCVFKRHTQQTKLKLMER